MGDSRLRLETHQGVFKWEDGTPITATFHPTHIEHEVRWVELPGVIGRLQVGLISGSAAMAMASIIIEPGTCFSGFLQLDFGGISTHGRTFSGAYFPPDSADDPRTEFTISEDGGVLSCPDYPERVVLRIGGRPICQAANGRLRAKWAVKLAAGEHFIAEGTWQLCVGPNTNSPMAPSDVVAAFVEIRTRDADLLAKSAAVTPELYIGPGFDAAVLTLENCWDQYAWLESTHWWSCFWTNNYQISAAVALGQWNRARQALEFFLDDQGYCPARLADGSRMGDGLRVGRYDGLPFWLHQLAGYVDATGDRELVLKLRGRVETCISYMLAARENEPGGLLNWFTGVNCTVYQADHLGWPGEATSPSFLAALALRDWGRLCQAVDDPQAAASWTRKADHIEQLARARLWDGERGCFFGHRDEQGHTFSNHYYSDHVYPVLYGNVLSLPEVASVLDFMRQELMFETASERLLMRVGTYLPPIFSNNNVMPTQMAEAAMAFGRLGENGTAARLLQAVGLASTLDTESPGSFPERLLDNGKGEANYGFGNPSGAYAMAVVNGLFGVALREGGEACQWVPGFPNDWPSAELHLPWVNLNYSQSSSRDGKLTRRYEFTSTKPRRLQFRVFLPVANAYRVLIDDREYTSTLAPGLGGTWLSLAAYLTARTSIEISFIPQPVAIPSPETLRTDQQCTWQIPAGSVTLDDPANALIGFELGSGRLTGRPRPLLHGFERHCIVYATLQSPPTMVPIAFTAVPPAALTGAELLVAAAAAGSNSARLHLKFRRAPGMGQPGKLIIDLGENQSVLPWQGEDALVLDVSPPGSGRVFAAIPLALRVRLQSADGSTLSDQQLVVTPSSSDPAVEATLRARRARQAEPVSLGDLPQASTLHVTFPWRYSPKFDLNLRAQADKGFECDGEKFAVRADQDSFCLVDGGISDQVTTRTPSSSLVPKSVVIPVKRRVCAVSLFFASEMEMRVSNARVGDIRLTYTEGADEVVPLVADRNFDALRGRSAPDCFPVRLNDKGDYLNVLRLPCSAARTLDRVILTMTQRDARLALVSLHTFPALE
jgi:hypothetical protein